MGGRSQSRKTNSKKIMESRDICKGNPKAKEGKKPKAQEYPKHMYQRIDGSGKFKYPDGVIECQTCIRGKGYKKPHQFFCDRNTKYNDDTGSGAKKDLEVMYSYKHLPKKGDAVAAAKMASEFFGTWTKKSAPVAAPTPAPSSPRKNSTMTPWRNPYCTEQQAIARREEREVASQVAAESQSVTVLNFEDAAVANIVATEDVAAVANIVATEDVAAVANIVATEDVGLELELLDQIVDSVEVELEADSSKPMAVEDLTVDVIKKVVQSRMNSGPFPAKLQLSKALYALVEYMWKCMPSLVGKSNQINTSNRAVNNKHKIKWLERNFGRGYISFVVPADSRFKDTSKPDKWYHSLQGTRIIFARWEMMIPDFTLHCVNPSTTTKCNGIMIRKYKQQLIRASHYILDLEGGRTVAFTVMYTCNCCGHSCLGTSSEFLHSLPSFITNQYPVDAKCAGDFRLQLGRSLTRMYEVLGITYVPAEPMAAWV
jgi:hypothetical protein